MTEAFVLGGVRTPFARYGSSLSHIRTDDLLGMTMKGACERVGVDLDADRRHRRRLRQPGTRRHGRRRPLGRVGGRVPRQRRGGHDQPVLRFVD